MKINLGIRKSTDGSLSNCLNVWLVATIAFNGFIKAIPVIIIENICMEVPLIHNINAVWNNAFPGWYANARTCFCTAAALTSGDITAVDSSTAYISVGKY